VYQITIDYPNMPKGQEVSIPGLGTYKNGTSHAVTEEEAELFRAYQTDTGMPDQTLLEAFKGHGYVTVGESGEDEAGSDDRDPGAPPEETRVPLAGPPHVHTKEGDQ
jgi:hypothetical protein